MKILLSALAVLALTSGAAVAGKAPSMTKQNLSWERKPQMSHMNRYFPAAAKSARVKDATVELACTPDVWGALDCQVVSETPAGLGFGEAAVQVVEKGRVVATDRAAVEGRTFGYKVHFGKGVDRKRASLDGAAEG